MLFREWYITVTFFKLHCLCLMPIHPYSYNNIYAGWSVTRTMLMMLVLRFSLLVMIVLITLMLHFPFKVNYALHYALCIVHCALCLATARKPRFMVVLMLSCIFFSESNEFSKVIRKLLVYFTVHSFLCFF